VLDSEKTNGQGQTPENGSKLDELTIDEAVRLEGAAEKAEDKDPVEGEASFDAEGEAAQLEAEDAAATGSKCPVKKPVSMMVTIIAVVVALIVGGVAGHFLFGGTFGMISGKTTISEAELDSVVGTYTYNGVTNNITARQAIDASSSVASAKQSDGTYTMPSADYVLSYARNAILNDEVAAKGITVTEEDMATYASDALGTDDYATIATQYGMTEDGVKQVVRESAGVKKLYDMVVTVDYGTAPEAPEELAEDAEDTPNATYGAYIVNLLGDNWDSATNTWANEDNDYYEAMKDMDFTSDSATYEQATTAYYVAYSLYSTKASEASTEWSTYVNGLLAKASITIGEVIS
jgi:hypothetical protein